MINDTFKLPKGMSQLDYLWTNFKGFRVSEGISEPLDALSLVTEQTLFDYLTEYSKDFLVSFETREVEGEVELVGIGNDGSEVCVVKFPKEEYLVNSEIISATQVELDNNVAEEFGEPLLVLTMLSGKQYFTSLKQFAYVGVETNSINTQVVDSKVISHLKLDKAIEKPVIDFKVTKDGLRIDLTTNETEKQLQLVRTENGLDVVRRFDDGNDVQLKIVNWAEYSLIQSKGIVPGTMYFVTDMNTMYLNNIQYGLTLKFPDTDTIYTEDYNGEIRSHVRIDEDPDNLISSSEKGVVAKLYWEIYE